MIILVGSKIDQSSIQAALGKPEYSYFFLLKDFLPALERLGQVISVKSIEEVNTFYRQYREAGEQVVFFSFTPPHQTPLDLACPTICVFAWEFDSLPSISEEEAARAQSGDWHADPSNDWSRVFSRLSGVIPTSREAAALVERSCQGRVPVVALPAPIWSRFASVCPEQGWPVEKGTRSFRFAGQVIDSRQLRLDPKSVAHRPYSEAKRISKALLQGWWHEVRLPMARPGLSQPEAQAPELRPVSVDGVVYTSVLNPADGRKNWIDMLSAFCWAFRDQPDATLILKMTHRDIELYRGTLLNTLARLSPFRCRVIALHGFLDDEQYLELIKATTYYVNASSGEGLCIPLMEFLSCGRPALAPAHTAMADYLNEDCAFLVDSCLQPTDWPHDPTGIHLTHSHRLNWESLMQLYRDSYEIAGDQARYSSMSRQASARLCDFSSLERVVGELQGFLAKMLSQSAPASQCEELPR
ncbi:glycosyltransferase [Pseudomonas sp. Gutcm_11s]|uniref:glycosyltransferase n=1 Tax=Pseudomonas sp. Gutcm_11s TaxID=3026088 RepID=UPI00235E1C03|nr:glycosyltransferase [Pseudomonas sp. Gutcm_11s]MDD0844985.1 glycosyltransferase [Pseudomonas sp. Gutcm_11s]